MMSLLIHMYFFVLIILTTSSLCVSFLLKYCFCFVFFRWIRGSSFLTSLVEIWVFLFNLSGGNVGPLTSAQFSAWGKLHPTSTRMGRGKG